MFDFKLQIGCLLVTIYYLLLYLRDTTGKNKLKCHPLFDCILAISPWVVIFDGVTAWTVNHQDVVPDYVNIIAHLTFLVSEELLIILVYAYMLKLLLGTKYTWKRMMLFLPGVISILVTVGTNGALYYVKGVNTNYSMGIPVYACFALMIFYFGYLAAIAIFRYKTIEKNKRLNVCFYIIFSFIVLGIQIVFPEVLISALLPVATLIVIYENFENANYRRLRIYNEEMVTSFATLVENRDDSTGGHIKRTKQYVSIIMREMLKKAEYEKIMTRDYVRHVIDAAPMHDIGKISTPDNILQKPGKLDDNEYEIMKQHAARGSEIISQTFAGIDDPEFLKIAYEVARYHHEKWDGKGYPENLSGEDIPLHARIMAIADVFDAVSAKRCYREAMPLEKCFQIIEEGAGKDFDPKLVEMFMSAKTEIIEYYIGNR